MGRVNKVLDSLKIPLMVETLREVQFVCSPGLMLLPPGGVADAWASNGTIVLPSCARGESVVLSGSVKSVDSEEMDYLKDLL